jgi:pantetheine-phosphate adenylyltransferase
MLLANRQLAGDVETIFLMADEDLAHVSSSLIKQITPVTTDAMLAHFVPAEIIPDIRARLAAPDGGLRDDL